MKSNSNKVRLAEFIKSNKLLDEFSSAFILNDFESMLDLIKKGFNPIEYVDSVKFNDINFTLRGYEAIRRIQKRMKRRFKIKDEASRIIGRATLHWLWSPNGPGVKRMIKRCKRMDCY